MLSSALDTLRAQAVSALFKIKTKEDLNEVRTHFLGKKGELRKVLSSLGSLDPEERVLIGQKANEIKEFLEEALLEKGSSLLEFEKNIKLKESIDISEPGLSISLGAHHPLISTAKDILAILKRLGFQIALGPQIEHDFYNFEALNIPESHPARDMQDTFYIDDKVMLRTHTSPVQIRAMLTKKNPPLRIISFGRVYRRDEDITHSPMFHQIEGLCIDEHISLADLKGTLENLSMGIFGKDVHIRMRPSFFPFTKPSVEVDVSCFMCKGKKDDCRLCKGTGWIEILGAGMVDPEVFNVCGYDSERFLGFAFGVGIERIAMLRFGIGDIRLFFENDLRFLRQF